MARSEQPKITHFFSKNTNPDPKLSTTSPAKITTTISYSPSRNPKRPLQQTLTSSPKKPKTQIANPCTKYTPLEKQFVDLKSEHPDLLLMVEVGYRYRFFGVDAENAAKVLGIYSHVDHNFLTASIPTFRLGFHVRRLVSNGFKVGVVKQTETAAIKASKDKNVGPFGRELVSVYTKATIEAGKDLGEIEEAGEGQNRNFLMCVVERELVEKDFNVRIGVVAIEVSTGEVVFGEFDDDFFRSGMEGELLGLGPVEILVGDPISTATEKLLLEYAGPSSNIRVERTSRDCFNDGGALGEVISWYEQIYEDGSGHAAQFGTAGENNHRQRIEGIINMPELSCQALALSIRHLKDFGLERIIYLGASFKPLSCKAEMKLSANTLIQLEILKNNINGAAEGSLLQVMNHTCTAFGSRLFKHWITHPLCDRNLISARLDAVSEIAESISPCSSGQHLVVLEDDKCYNQVAKPELCNLLSTVLSTCGRSPDIERGITRIIHRTAKPAEFVAVISAILACGKQLSKIHVEDEDGDGYEVSEKQTLKSTLLRRLIHSAASSTILTHARELLSFLDNDAANQGDMLNLFKASISQFPEVYKGRVAVEMAEDELNSLIVHYRKQLGMRKLEFINISGTTHLIELPTDARVPTDWIKINSTKKTVRYHPPEVLKALDRLTLAKEELAVICKTTWSNFLSGFSNYYDQFQAAVQAIAALDCLHSLAIPSKNLNYVRPVFVDDDEPCQIDIQSGYHPVLGSILGDNFVPNDTNLHADSEYCQIITGPNMGGKSCYIRQVALLAIMAQAGSFVPAISAKFHVLDGIYTRMGASDNIQQGRSTFFEELSEASYTLRNCSSKSLVILDELGRGTSTHDGVAIAYSTLRYLLKHKKCMVLFVTHYPQILDIQNEFQGSVGAYHVSYLTSENRLDNMESESEASVRNIDKSEVTFLYKVVSGASTQSFGLNVAKLAQLPFTCIERAAFMAAKFEADVKGRESYPTQKLIFILRQILSYIRASLNDYNQDSVRSSLMIARELAFSSLSDVGKEQLLLEQSCCDQEWRSL